MTRYWYFDEAPIRLPHDFQVESTGAVKTGLLTADGREIMRGPEPIGFVHHHDIPEPKPRIRVKAVSA